MSVQRGRNIVKNDKLAHWLKEAFSVMAYARTEFTIQQNMFNCLVGAASASSLLGRLVVSVVANRYGRGGARKADSEDSVDVLSAAAHYTWYINALNAIYVPKMHAYTVCALYISCCTIHKNCIRLAWAHHTLMMFTIPFVQEGTFQKSAVRKNLRFLTPSKWTGGLTGAKKGKTYLITCVSVPLWCGVYFLSFTVLQWWKSFPGLSCGILDLPPLWQVVIVLCIFSVDSILPRVRHMPWKWIVLLIVLAWIAVSVNRVVERALTRLFCFAYC